MIQFTKTCLHNFLSSHNLSNEHTPLTNRNELLCYNRQCLKNMKSWSRERQKIVSNPLLNEAQSPTQKTQHTFDTNKISNRPPQDFCCLVLSNPTYYTYSLYELICNHILFTYLIERIRNMCPIHISFYLSVWGSQNVLDCKLSRKILNSCSIGIDTVLRCVSDKLVRCHSDNSRILSSQNVCSSVVEIYQSTCSILMTLTSDLYSVHTLYT